MHFVLGTNLAQLRNSIMVAYGSNIDAQVYLQKFIQLTLFLVDQGQYPHERIVTKFVNHLVKVMEFSAEHRELVEFATPLIRHTAEHRSLSLRAIEQIMSTLAMALASKPKNAVCPGPILAGICILRVTDPELFAKAKAGNLIFEDVRDPLAFWAAGNQNDKGEIEHCLQLWQYSTDPSLTQDDPLVREFASSSARYHMDRLRLVPFVANAIVDRFSLG